MNRLMLKGTITTNLMFLSVAPLLIFGILVLLITSGAIYSGRYKEVRYGLNTLTIASRQTYELLYPGNYLIDGDTVTKGGSNLSEHMGFVDEIKQTYGADATIFIGNKRYLTTIRRLDGTRVLGSRANSKVTEAVLVRGENYFSDNVSVNNVPYFGYYVPLQSSSGEIVGMLFVGKPRTEVMREIEQNILMVCIVAACIIGIAIFLSLLYSRSITDALNKVKKFLGNTAQGDLTAQLSPALLNRHDELGEMGRFSAMLQLSITDLVGKDPLTGLSNRRCSDIVLHNLAEKCKEQDKVFSVVMADIDYFKRINDTYGHPAGDEVLKMVSSCLSAHMNRLGFVFRWGGEEFLLVYEDLDKESVLFQLKQLQAAISSSMIEWEGSKISITMTFGIADFKEEKDIGKLIQLADSNLYKGKHAGRNRIICSRRTV